MTKVSAQTFARGCKKRIQLGKRILDVINRKYFTLILGTTILINCTGKFCCRQGNFQKREATTEDFLKNFTKFIGKRLCQSLFFNKFIKKETPTQALFCKLCEIFKNNFFVSDCFSEYGSLCMAVVGYSCLVKNCSENIWKISRSISASSCNFR